MSWFSKKVHETVDAITADFTEMMTSLEDLAVRKIKEAEDNIAQALHLQSMADLAKAEAVKAQAVIDNVRNIFNTTKSS